jgi:SAM-dependent methyltransferase
VSGAPPDPFDIELLAIASTRTWQELVELVRLHGAPRTEAQARADARYAQTAETRSARMLDMLMHKARATAARRGIAAPGAKDRAGTVLDLGAGFGAALHALAARFEYVIAIEPERARAIVAQTRATELGVSERVTLACTDGVRLPIANASVDVVVAVNVLEHLCDALAPALAEVARVLAPGGWFLADSRNRYDLLFPEPHARLRGLGLLPRAWQEPYARLRGVRRLPPTRLLSRGELVRALRQHFTDVEIGLAAPSAFEHAPAFDPWVDMLARSRVLAPVAAQLYPSHVVVARR